MVRYEEDLAAWAEQTADALRNGRSDSVDWLHVAEEIDDVGSELEHALESRMMQVLLHLLKHRYQPEMATRSWDLSIKEQRLRSHSCSDGSPSLRNKSPEVLGSAYEVARVRAARQTGLDLNDFLSNARSQSRKF